MICPKCGAQVPDGSSFCTNCSAPLAQQAPAYAPYQSPYAPPSQPAYAAPAPDSTGVVHKALKGLATSPMALIAAIALSLAIVLGIVGAMTNSSSVAVVLEDNLARFSDEFNISESDMREIRKMLSEVPDVSLSSAVVAQIPQILICVGVWMVLISAFSQTSRMSGSGLTVIKVITIISLVFACVGAGILVILAIVGIVVGIAQDIAILPVISGIFLFFFAVFAAFLIIYYAKTVKTLNTMRSVIDTGAPNDRVSSFVAVICIIGGAGAGMSFLGSITLDLFNALANAANAVALILFGLLIFKFRNTMQEVMRMAPAPVGGYVPPSYSGASCAQQPANPYGNPVTVCPNCRNQHSANDAVCPFCGYSSAQR
ncbi:MAG: zinc ribbon domain-containing protein [Clostridia bacterium]|nr:zinc ribbon domain-containing protein [Clostridia bacterium]